jgi:hypothetical protein
MFLPLSIASTGFDEHFSLLRIRIALECRPQVRFQIGLCIGLVSMKAGQGEGRASSQAYNNLVIDISENNSNIL